MTAMTDDSDKDAVHVHVRSLQARQWGEGFKMHFERGQRCWNGPDRSTTGEGVCVDIE